MTDKLRAKLDWAPWPLIDEAQKAAVLRVLESGKINYWTGPEGRAFEKEYAAYLGASNALAVSNGTVALELALRSFGIGAGDEVIVPSRTFIATAGAVVAVGATPIICDIDPNTNNMTAVSVSRALTRRTKAVIVVHLGGYPADVEAIASLASQVDAVVIEDCAQAHGARLRSRAVGTIGDAGCFSFCQDKIIPLGEGGLVTFKDEEAYKRAWSYRDHGRSYAKTQSVGAGVSGASAQFKYLIDSFGSNFRMTELEAAMGRIALSKLDEMVEKRTKIAKRISSELSDIEALKFLTLQEQELKARSRHAYYRLYARVNAQLLKDDWTRDRIIEEINERGIPCQYGSSALIGRELAFERFMKEQVAELEGARKAHASSIAFFIHPTLEDANVDELIAVVRSVMQEASR